MLGEAKVSDLLKKAAAEHIDVLFVYEVDVRQGPNSVINTTKIQLFNVATKEVLHAGTSLTAGNVAKAREEKKGPDPVDADMERIFNFVDEKLKPAPLKTDTANADRVAKYVDGLAAEKHDNPLPVLAEIRFYQSAQLINSDKLTEAYGVVLGKELGDRVAAGNPDQVMETLAKWLPEQRPKSLADAGGAKKAGAGGFFNKLFGK